MIRFRLHYDQVEDAMKYLRENDEATIKFYQGNAFHGGSSELRRPEGDRDRAGR